MDGREVEARFRLRLVDATPVDVVGHGAGRQGRPRASAGAARIHRQPALGDRQGGAQGAVRPDDDAVEVQPAAPGHDGARRSDGPCVGCWAWDFFGTCSLELGAFIADILWPVPQFPFLSPQSTARTPPSPSETSECSGCDDRGCLAVRCGRHPGTPNSADASN